MEKSEMIRIAKYAIYKNMDCDTLHYCDDMYGKEEFTEDVWKYVTECREIGTVAFNEKYPE